MTHRYLIFKLLISVLVTVVFTGTVHAQFSEDFSDLELTSNPAWQGTPSTFLINTDTVLQLNDVIAGTSHLSTTFSSTSLDNVEWQFFIKQTFAGSGSNYGRVYLASDQTDVSGPLNGYYLQFGEALSNDAVELFHQSGGTSTSVCRGTEALIASTVNMRVRVRRDGSGNWTLEIDPAGGYSFVPEASGTHNTLTSTTNFGLLCVYTASNATKFFYDDLYMGPYILDVTAPELVSVSVISSTELDVQFNEPVSQATAEALTNYSVDGGIGNPSAATLDANTTLVHLTFSTGFTNGTQYLLSVSGIEDLGGNVMAGTDEPFQYVVTSAASFRDVVINEFMADQSPVIGLPEAEFIELFNASSNFIDITDWKISDGSSDGTVGSHIIAPGEFVLLVATASVPLFAFYGDVVGVTSFPSLNNSGDMIVLRDASDLLIDRLTYDLSWYQDATKEDGGYTLEQINPFAACTKAQNWHGSVHFNGGTPNVENSVYDDAPDTTGPSLILVDITGASELLLHVSEPLDSALVTSASVSLSPSIGVLTANSVTPDHSSIAVALSAPLDTAVYYTVHILGQEDCEGNGQEGDTSRVFIIPFTADSGDLVINEVLSDPFTGATDYVELVNVSERIVNLKGWQLASFDEEDGIANHRTIITTNYAVPVGGYVLITEDTTATATNYIQHGIGNFIEADMPSYNNDSGTVYLLNIDSVVMERFAYNDEMHFSLLDVVDGVSLERLDPNRPVNDVGNWHSAAQSVGFGTPGLQNSQYFPTGAADGEVSTEPEIFSPFDGDGHNDLLNINYAFTVPGTVATVRVYDANGRPVRELATNELLAASGTFTWDGTTDKGEKARIGMYIILFESFNATGKTNTYKMSTVLGGRL